MMKRYGLIGYPLSHSFSPDYFRRKFKEEHIENTSYDLFPIESLSNIRKTLPKNILGFNVTIPYKRKIMDYMDNIDGVAKELNAINTVKVIDDKWIGYNTDVYGFEQSLKGFIKKRKVNYALILGSGGGASAVKYVLDKMEIKSNIVSRGIDYLSYKNLHIDLIESIQLIVNTTPLGMYPNCEDAPDIPYNLLGKKHLLFDLIYNPQNSLFLKKGAANNCLVKNGLEMLQLQADKSWSIWTNSSLNPK